MPIMTDKNIKTFFDRYAGVASKCIEERKTLTCELYHQFDPENVKESLSGTPDMTIFQDCRKKVTNSKECQKRVTISVFSNPNQIKNARIFFNTSVLPNMKFKKQWKSISESEIPKILAIPKTL